jgi:hypothetical protein
VNGNPGDASDDHNFDEELPCKGRCIEVVPQEENAGKVDEEGQKAC